MLPRLPVIRLPIPLAWGGVSSEDHTTTELLLCAPGPGEQADVLGNECAQFLFGMFGISGHGELHGPLTSQ